MTLREVSFHSQRGHISTKARQANHDYLRISLTERCNLRCFYCMPSEGIQLSPKGHILTDDEIVRLASLFVRSGVKKIRLTGGEPTVRKGLGTIISRLAHLRSLGLEAIGMTSNGLALHRQLPDLVDKGLTHLNLSLDTLDPFKFEIMARRMGHDAVLKSLDVALSCPGLQSVKLNVVVIKGLNDAEILDFVNLTKHKKLWVRFIEFMPFTGNKWDKAKMVPSAELLAVIKAQFPTVERMQTIPNDTARLWKIPGHSGGIGFISSMSDHFCSTCNRLRITADGQIKVCLFDGKEISLRDEMRRGASDDELLQIIRSAVWGKKEKHAGMDKIDAKSNRPMILIGGTQFPTLKRPCLRSRGLTALAYTSGPGPITSRLSTTTCVQRRWSTHSGSREPRLTHLDATDRPSVVDVSSKEPTKRTATAVGSIYIPKIAYDLVSGVDPSPNTDLRTTSSLERALEKSRNKGHALTVAQLAAIMGCKRTSELIPLCHPLQLSNISVTLTPERVPCGEGTQQVANGLLFRIQCTATVSCESKTGVEMEALTAVAVGLLTVWDMLKAVAGKEMMIGDIIVSRKTGGKSGDFVRQENK
ncbi:molybdenum cofactor biosynthesis prote [Scleroderma citrinum]